MTEAVLLLTPSIRRQAAFIRAVLPGAVAIDALRVKVPFKVELAAGEVIVTVGTSRAVTVAVAVAVASWKVESPAFVAVIEQVPAFNKTRLVITTEHTFVVFET